MKSASLEERLARVERQARVQRGILIASVVAGTVLLSTTHGATRERLRNIKHIVAGSGLIGGGTGPQVRLGIGPEQITSDHVMDGSLQVDDFAAETREALRGEPGLPGTTPESEVSHRELTADVPLPNYKEISERETVLTDLSTNFTLSKPRIVRLCGQVTLATLAPSEGEYDSSGWKRVRVMLNGIPIGTASEYGRLSAALGGPFYPLTVGRILRLDPGQYSLTVHVFNNKGYTVVRDDPYTRPAFTYNSIFRGEVPVAATYLDIELQ